MTPVVDPVLVKRERMRRFSKLGIRVGMGLFLLASVLFFWAVANRFTPALANGAAFCLLAGSVLLAPAMVLKYTIKAADRADREDSW